MEEIRPPRESRDSDIRKMAPVVQRLDNAIHRINHYPADSVVCFVKVPITPKIVFRLKKSLWFCE